MSILNRFAKPNQPIEAWLIVAQTFPIGILDKELKYSWMGRTLLFEATAEKMKEVHAWMPAGCRQDNSWVFATLTSKGQTTVIQYSKSDFLAKFVDVPMLPSDIFFKSYQAYINDIDSHLQRIREIISGKK